MSDPRQEKFIPLAAGTLPAQASGELNVTLLRDSAHIQSFQPLRQTAPPPAPSAPSASAPPPAFHQHEPEVIIQRDGERVTGIQIKCGCGKVIELGCVYGASKA